MQKHFSFLWQLADYATSDLMMSGENFEPKAGIFARPLLITAASSSSDCFCTSSDLRSFAFSALPVGVFPLPSGPWHNVQLFLNTLAASLWARTTTGRTKIVKVIKNAAGAKRCNIFCM